MSSKSCLVLLSRINRNIVECKVEWITVKTCIVSVLIETLWNVKRHMALIISALKTVLIETLWNVKYDIGDLWSQDGGGINRNIVECKGKTDKANFFDQNMY